ncbi:hypothetical protein PoB_000616900 [Plakobranchus ocellatus]|uniref:Uncharacterized protein n=1 Tax=Plakobranchus ocellatus TaxID=259542 RepID=A0AAV3Y9M3_9GAST|nr:hypothetical protein PoB_000616900 [Plakobranchus ocellatus]
MVETLQRKPLGDLRKISENLRHIYRTLLGDVQETVRRTAGDLCKICRKPSAFGRSAENSQENDRRPLGDLQETFSRTARDHL